MATYGSKACRVEFLSSGFKALLMGREVRETIYQVSKAIAKDAGEGFEARPFYARTAGRVMATVDAATPEAMERQATDKVLYIAAVKPRSIK